MHSMHPSKEPLTSYWQMWRPWHHAGCLTYTHVSPWDQGRWPVWCAMVDHAHAWHGWLYSSQGGLHSQWEGVNLLSVPQVALWPHTPVCLRNDHWFEDSQQCIHQAGAVGASHTHPTASPSRVHVTMDTPQVDQSGIWDMCKYGL